MENLTIEQIKKQILKNMDAAAREDRENFLRATDFVAKSSKLTTEQKEEMETARQNWRDMTGLAGYPNINFPLAMTDWFTGYHCSSNWEKDTYIENEIRRMSKSNG